MAVKASAHITLSIERDIEAYYRYYLLQSSTLAKPSKPTTNPPSSSWDDTEPTYTAGSTNSLYFVDLTVFTDGTWSYSDVSLSSSYEAAKEAYNKAVAAGETASDAQDSANQAQNTADDASTRINAAELTINTINACISSLVIGSNGESLMTQTEDGWQFNIGTMQDTLNTTSTTLNTLTNQVGSVQGTVSSLQTAVNDLGVLAEYVRITTYYNEETGNNEPCIELGESDSDFKVLITNTRILFMEGSNTPTYIKDNTLMTNNVEVKNELRQNYFDSNDDECGHWIWSVRQNGNYGLIWKEV